MNTTWTSPITPVTPNLKGYITIIAVMDEIIDNLWVGTATEVIGGGPWDGWMLLCVLEELPSGIGGDNVVHLPVYDPPTGRAIDENLDLAATYIHLWLTAGCKVLVFCAQGVERSPLTVAYYLSRVRGITLGEAYNIIRRARPIVADRSSWLTAT